MVSVHIDLSVLPSDHWYEDRYRGYIEIFHRIAHTPADEEVVITNPPASWIPLLKHLNCRCVGARTVFEHCPHVNRAMGNARLDRTMLEVLCNFRPETADCLWKCDMQWQVPEGRVRKYDDQKEFIVTTNGAYHRPEVLEFLKRLKDYVPTKRNVLLVPCAADKPYPSALHKACLEMLPDDFYLMNATGVLGLVPQDLWDIMPWYDSGIPNQWRLFEIARTYFAQHQHDRVVVYCDFYASTLAQAFKVINQEAHVTYILPPIQYDDYVNLLDPDLLSTLKASLETHGVGNGNGNGRSCSPMDV